MALNLLGAQMGGGFTGGTAVAGGGDQGGSTTGGKTFNFGPPGGASLSLPGGPVGILFAVVAALLVLLWVLRSTKR